MTFAGFWSAVRGHDESFSYRVTETLIADNQDACESYDDEEAVADREFELLVKAYMRDNQYQSRYQATANIIYGTLNAGFVALPYACDQVGIPIYVFCVLVVSCIAGYTTVFVIKLADDQGVVAGQGSIPRTLEDLSEVAYGFKGYCIVATLQILLSLTFMCLSLNVWGEILSSILTCRLEDTHVLGASMFWLLTERMGGVLIGGAVLLPLVVSSSTVASLRWTSYTTIICIASAIIAAIVAFVHDENSTTSPESPSSAMLGEVSHIKSQWWVVFLIVTLCFSYNQKAFSVYSSLRRRNAKRWDYSVKRANFFIVCLYVLFGSLGYLSHIQELPRFNFFLDFDGLNSLVFDLTRGIVALGLLLVFPMDTLVAATTARRLWRRLSKKRNRSVERIRQSDFPGGCDTDLLSSLHSGDSSEISSNVANSEIGRKSIESGEPDLGPHQVNDSFDLSSISPHDVRIGNSKPNGNGESNVTSNTSMLTTGSFANDFVEVNDECDEARNRTADRSNFEEVTIESGDDDAEDEERDSSVNDQPGRDSFIIFGIPFISSLPAMLTFWLLAVCCAVAVDAGVVMAATIGGISTSIMVFILPSMLYFKLGLTSDFQESPIIGSFVSNTLYMTCTQILGAILLLGNLFFIGYWLVNPQVSFNNVIEKTGN